MSGAGLHAASARARGLSSRLFTRQDAEDLAGLDLAGLSRALSRHPKLAEPPAFGAGAQALDASAAITAQRLLVTLRRWAGPEDPVFEVIESEQDRRILRALLRGAVQGAPAEERRAGLQPTGSLPARAIVELSKDATPLAMTARLTALGHPAARALRPLVSAAQVELARLEQALAKDAAHRAVRAARRGDAALRRFVAFRIDASNAATALLLAGGLRDDSPATRFIEGGAALDAAAFVAAAGAPSRTSAAGILARALAGSPLAAVAQRGEDAPAAWERESLALELAEALRLARVDPLGTAPLLLFLLRLDAQSRDLRRIVHGAALGVPASALRKDLVTPWS